MGILSKTRLEQAAEAVDLAEVLRVAARSTLDSALGQSQGAANAATRPARSLSGVAKPGLVVAGGFAAITAASAALSAMRRSQSEE